MPATVSVGGRRVGGPMSIPQSLITDGQYDRHTLVDELLHLGLHTFNRSWYQIKENWSYHMHMHSVCTCRFSAMRLATCLSSPSCAGPTPVARYDTTTSEERSDSSSIWVNIRYYLFNNVQYCSVLCDQE